MLMLGIMFQEPVQPYKLRVQPVHINHRPHKQVVTMQMLDITPWVQHSSTEYEPTSLMDKMHVLQEHGKTKQVNHHVMTLMLVTTLIA